jgi:hypothetical protein
MEEYDIDVDMESEGEDVESVLPSNSGTGTRTNLEGCNSNKKLQPHIPWLRAK